MSTYATSCIQTLDYLLRKHDKMLSEAVRLPDTLKLCEPVDHKPTVPVTVEEHDRILELCRTSGLSNNQISRRTGRSPTVVSTIRRHKHPLYDAVRCEPMSKAS